MVKDRFLYYFFYGLFFIIFKIIFRLKIIGKENIPLKEPLIIVANHFSILDPLILTCCTKRIIHWMVASWVYEVKILSFIVKDLPFLKVYSNKPNNKEAIQKAIEFLKNSEVVGIFPEGGLSKTGQIRPFLEGASYLGIKTGSCILPIYIKGTYQALPPGRKWLRFNRIYVIIGKGFFLPPHFKQASSREIRECNRLILEKIEELSFLFKNENYSQRDPCSS